MKSPVGLPQPCHPSSVDLFSLCCCLPPLPRPLFQTDAGIMRQKQRKITDISFDVLLHVMLRLSKSPSGAKNLSRTSAVCRVFKELALDPMILEAVTFDDVNISEIHKSFWKSNGFLFRCIRAGNPNAFCTALNYVETLCASFKTIHGNFCRAAMTLRISSLEVQIVNTRARRRAYNQAFDDLYSAYHSSDKCYKKTLTFWLELTEAIMTVRADSHLRPALISLQQSMIRFWISFSKSQGSSVVGAENLQV